MNNNLKTIILFSALCGMLIFLGNIIAGPVGLIGALVISLAINFISYFYSDKIVLKMYSAQPLDKDKYIKVYNIINVITQEQSLPMPKLWLIETPMANAFATGRDHNHANIAVTTGILDILNNDELTGVLAHEISHIKNYDILISSAAAVISSSIGFIANLGQHINLNQKNYEKDSRPRINPILLFIIIILIPIAATFIRLAISRNREYEADETGANICHKPLALADALIKLHEHNIFNNLNQSESIAATTAHLFIINPFTNLNNINNLFSTHPPLELRIKKLNQIYKKTSGGTNEK